MQTQTQFTLTDSDIVELLTMPVATPTPDELIAAIEVLLSMATGE